VTGTDTLEASPSRAVGPLGLWIGIGTVGAVAMVLTGSGIGSVPHPAADHWWFTVHIGTGVAAHLAFYTSVAVLLIGWAGVGMHAYRGRLDVPTAWLVLGLWGLPFLLGTPLFSRDLYSYVAQGQLARHGLNPYLVAPSALGPGEVLSSVARVWRHTASPYGPLFVSASRLATALGGASLVAQILVLRALELVGVVLMMVSLPTLARRLGNDPGLALWLAVLSPLALFSFISSGHNDALMVGLMVAGITMGTGGRLRWGIALCAVAATIKLPAVAGVVFLVADECTRLARAARARVVGEAVAITGLVVGAVTLGAGFGWTWLSPSALRVPTELKVLITPMVSIGSFVGGVLHAVGLPVSVSNGISVVQALGELAAVTGILWMVLHTRDRDAVRFCGLALVLFVVLSPTLWPWYLTWGVALLAATSVQRSKALAVVAGLAMFVVGAGGTPLLNGGDYWVVGPLLVGAGIWFVWSGSWRSALGRPVDVV
jgi:Glycosyltransferase family 87